MQKIFIILNIISAVILWIFLGILIDVGIGMLMLEYPDIVISWLRTEIVFYLVFLLPILSSCVIGIYLEFKKSSNKVIIFFQGSIIKKIFLIVAIFLLGLLWMKLDTLLYGRYRKWADTIAIAIAQKSTESNNEETLIEVDNHLDIDYLIVASGGPLGKEYLLKTGIAAGKLADNLAYSSRHADSDTTYIYLARKNKVVAISSIPFGPSVVGPPQLIKVEDKIKFHIKRQKYRDNFGKEFTLLVIHKVE